MPHPRQKGSKKKKKKIRGNMFNEKFLYVKTHKLMAKDKLEKYIFQINTATEANTLNIQKTFVKYRALKKDGRCEVESSGRDFE